MTTSLQKIDRKMEEKGWVPKLREEKGWDEPFI